MRRPLLLVFVLINAVLHGEADSSRLFNAGKKAFQSGLYTIALENLSLFNQKYPHHKKADDSLYLRGVSSYYLKDYEKARDFFQGLEEEFAASPYTRRTDYWIGLCSFALKEYPLAIESFDDQIESPDVKYRAASWLYRGVSFHKQGNRDEARESYLKVLEVPGVSGGYAAESYYRLGGIFLEEKKFSKALLYLVPLILNHNDSRYFYEANYLAAECYYFLKEWREAERKFRQVVDFQNDREGDALRRLMDITYSEKRYEECEEYLSLFHEKKGYTRETMNLLVNIYGQQKRWSDAAGMLEKILALPLNREERSSFEKQLASVLYSDGRFKESYGFLKKYSDDKSLYFAGVSAYKGGMREEGSAALSALVNIHNSSDYLRTGAELLVKELKEDQNYGELKGVLLTLIDSPADHDGFFTLILGEITMETGNYDESIKYLGSLLNSDRGDFSRISYNLGRIYSLKEEYARAAGYFEQIPKESELYFLSRYALGIACFQLEDYAKGEKLFKEVALYKGEKAGEASHYLALIKKRERKFSEAAQWFYTAAEAGYEVRESRINQGWCLLQLKEWEKAFESFSKVLEGPQDELWYVAGYQAANALSYMNEKEKALELYKKGLGASDNKIREESYYKLSKISLRLKKREEAFRVLKEFQAAFPESQLPSEALYKRGEELYALGNYSEALTYYDDVVELFPSSDLVSVARFWGGKSLSLLREKEAASLRFFQLLSERDLRERAVKELASLGKESPESCDRIVRQVKESYGYTEWALPLYLIYFEQNILNEGILKEMDNYTLKPSHPYYTELELSRANYYKMRKEYEAAVELLEDLKETGGLQAWKELAWCYEALKNSSQAQKSYFQIYLYYSENSEEASMALYKAWLLSEERYKKKIEKILKEEYGHTLWAKRVLDE